ncbi:hypothetical protein ACUM5Y_06630 [Marinomonas dokdonensis]|uniref:hypothetical protein n=1 Tax=Marinomonas dokdonensis TaxID=328224 RepID=UPI0040558EA9
MMIVDLVDEVDLKEALMEIGVPIKLDDTLEQVKQAVMTWLVQSSEHAAELDKMYIQLNDPNVTLLPEVAELVYELTSL